MIIQIYDNVGRHHDIKGDGWRMEEDRYKFYQNGEIVAIFQKEGITGFILAKEVNKR